MAMSTPAPLVNVFNKKTSRRRLPVSLCVAAGTIGCSPIVMFIAQHAADASPSGLLQYGPLGCLVLLTLSCIAALLKILDMQRAERAEGRDALMTYAKDQRTDFLAHNSALLAECERNTKAAIKEAVDSQREWFTAFFDRVSHKKLG